MKNEPVVTYNHMQEDKNSEMSAERETLPISLYMLLVVDAILITAIVVFAIKFIF
jgi:hypothetical protein